jgi:hypothetical protein
MVTSCAGDVGRAQHPWRRLRAGRPMVYERSIIAIRSCSAVDGPRSARVNAILSYDLVSVTENAGSSSGIHGRPKAVRAQHEAVGAPGPGCLRMLQRRHRCTHTQAMLHLHGPGGPLRGHDDAIRPGWADRFQLSKRVRRIRRSRVRRKHVRRRGRRLGVVDGVSRRLRGMESVWAMRRRRNLHRRSMLQGTCPRWFVLSRSPAVWLSVLLGRPVLHVLTQFRLFR